MYYYETLVQCQQHLHYVILVVACKQKIYILINVSDVILQLLEKNIGKLNKKYISIYLLINLQMAHSVHLWLDT